MQGTLYKMKDGRYYLIVLTRRVKKVYTFCKGIQGIVDGWHPALYSWDTVERFPKLFTLIGNNFHVK